MKSLICPQCGAPAQLGFGRVQTFCEYCGCQIRDQLTEAESATVGKNKEFVDAVEAAINCIQSNDYQTAMKYADKAENLISSDPAPLLIKYIANLNTDFNKSESFHSIANNMMSQNPSIILDDDKYKALLATFFMNYMSDRDVDFKRVFANTRKVKPDDIKNVMRYEDTKRTRYFVTHQELNQAMKQVANQTLADSSKNMNFSGQLDQANWTGLQEYRNKYLFKAISIAILDPSLAPQAAEATKKYSDALDMKWESAFKNGVSGSKDEVKTYRNEAEVILNTLKTIR